MYQLIDQKDSCVQDKEQNLGPRKINVSFIMYFWSQGFIKTKTQRIFVSRLIFQNPFTIILTSNELIIWKNAFIGKKIKTSDFEQNYLTER